MDPIEAVIRRNCRPYTAKENEDYIVARMREIYDELPYPELSFSVDFSELEHLQPRDRNAVFRLTQNLGEQILEEMRHHN